MGSFKFSIVRYSELFWILSILLLFGGLLTSCKSVAQAKTYAANNPFEIVARNLSEDGSFLSSKNDELLLLVMEVTDEGANSILVDSFVVDSPGQKNNYEPPNFDFPKRYVLALIEIDSHKDLSFVQSLVENNYLRLIEYYNSHDLDGIQDILGDEDLLGIRFIDVQTRKLVFSGSHRGDYYEYIIRY